MLICSSQELLDQYPARSEEPFANGSPCRQQGHCSGNNVFKADPRMYTCLWG